jgi:hypothetical protein
MSAMQDSGAQYGCFILISYPPTRPGELAAHTCCQQTPADLASSSLSRVPKQSLTHAPPPFLLALLQDFITLGYSLARRWC